MARSLLISSSSRTTAGLACLAVLRLGLGLVLVIAGLAKMRNPFLFLSEIYDYELVGPGVGVAVASVLPAIEVVVGCCLLFGVMLPGAFATCSVLAVIFICAAASALARELRVTCGCFSGYAQGKIGYDTVFRSGVMLLASISGIILACWLQREAGRPSGAGMRDTSVPFSGKEVPHGAA